MTQTPPKPSPTAPPLRRYIFRRRWPGEPAAEPDDFDLRRGRGRTRALRRRATADLAAEPDAPRRAQSAPQAQGGPP